MLVVRSLAFNVLFYLSLILWLILLIPCTLLPRKSFVRCVQAWGRFSLWLMRVTAGTRVEFRGLDNIPSGGLLVASKHQSFLETFALVTMVDDPTFILKRELTWIPFFGWYTLKAGQISVDRSAGTLALVQMNERARVEAARGRQILIFPEGTRRAPGAEPSYKFGIVHLYGETGMTCLPIALNSGLFWPRRSFLRYPGTIVAEILDPIVPGLSKDEFAARLQQDVETATARLIAEGERELAKSGIRSAPAARTSA